MRHTLKSNYVICIKVGNPHSWADFLSWMRFWHFLFPLKETETSSILQILQGRATQKWFRKGDRNHPNQDRWDLQGTLGQGCVPWAPWTILSTILSTSSHSKRAQRHHTPCSLGKRHCPTTNTAQHNTTSAQHHQHFPQGAVGNTTWGS